MLFCTNQKRKYRDKLFENYRREYPANTEHLKEKYVFLKAEMEGTKVTFGVYTYIFALISLGLALFGRSATIECDFISNAVFIMMILLIILTLRARINVEKKIIEMNVIKEIFPYVNGVHNKDK